MKKIFTLLVCFLLMINIEAGRAQNGKPLALPSQQPVLIDDTHPESQRLAKENRDRQYASVLSVLSNLSEKQKKSIIRIEAKRDKKLKQTDELIALKMERLTALNASDLKDVKLMDITTNEISKLAIEKQKTEASAMKKIRSLLTKKQRIIFDNIK